MTQAELLADLASPADVVLRERDNPEQRLAGVVMGLIYHASHDEDTGRDKLTLLVDTLYVDVTDAPLWPGNKLPLLITDEVRGFEATVQLIPTAAHWLDDGRRWVINYRLEMEG